MKKLLRYCIILCFLSFILTACHGKADQPETYESNMGTIGWESSKREEYTKTEDTQTTEQHDISRENDAEANTFEILESDYILPNSDTQLYSQVELEVLSPEQIKLARNEIYARHGRKFKDKSLQDYFQSKSWYQGTVEPDKFDDGLLNQTEHDNISLLIRLDEDMKGKTKVSDSQEGNSLDEAVTVTYKDIVNKNQYRQLYLTTEEWFDNNEQVRSQIIDHSTYFEVTNCSILADTCYDLSVMEGKGVGDILELNNSLYRIMQVQTWCLENGENVYLEYISGTDDAYFPGYYMLVRNYKDNYYILVGEDADTRKDTLYEGSLYIRKDCITTVKNPGNEFKDHTVDIKDYLTQNRNVVGSQFGLSLAGGLVLWGDFKIDSSGFIIVYSEYFLS